MDDLISLSATDLGDEFASLSAVDFVPTMPGLLEAVSAAMVEMSAAFTAVEEQLSAHYLHPYEATKLALFPVDYVFPTIDDIEFPEGIAADSLASKITQYEKDHQSRLLDYIVNPDKFNTVTEHDHFSILAELSGENTFVVTDDKYRTYIEHLEIVRTMDLDNLTPDRTKEIIHKLAFNVVKMLGTNTIKLSS